MGSIPGSGRSPTPVVLPGKPHGERSLAGYSPWSLKSQTRLSATPPPPGPTNLVLQNVQNFSRESKGTTPEFRAARGARALSVPPLVSSGGARQTTQPAPVLTPAVGSSSLTPSRGLSLPGAAAGTFPGHMCSPRSDDGAQNLRT